MQSNIFAKVAPLLKEKKLNIDCNAVLEFLEQHYKSIFDVPDSIECIHCDNEIVRPAEHAIIVYKVL